MNNLKDGVWLIKKTSGPSSHDVVKRARQILGHRDVGHCGTLDPMAEGLLILISGEATKVSQYLLEGNKQYKVGVKFGILTDSLDATGNVLKEERFEKSEAEVIEAGLKFQGEFQWNVPIFSAVKVNGEKLYDIAHRGETAETPVKTMKFWGNEYHGMKDGVFYFSLNCSKGSYIRTWCKELGESLGSLGCMMFLERTGSTPYKIEDALSLDDLSEVVAHGKVSRGYKPLKSCLPHLKVLRVEGKTEALMRNGVISHDLRLQLIQAFKPEHDEVIQVKSSEGDLLSLIGLEKEKGFQVRRVFKTQ